MLRLLNKKIQIVRTNPNTTSTDWLGLAFLFGVFFASVTLNIIPGETSAVAGFFGFIILLIRGSLKSKKIFSYFFIIFILSSIYCYLFVHDDLFEILKQFFAYMQILIVFLCIKYIRFDKLEPFIKAWVILDIAIYLFQFTGVGSEILGPIMESLISRGGATQLIDSGRGISGFTSEPSQMAIAIFVHAFMILYCGYIYNRDYSLFSLAYILTAILLSASGTGVVLFLVFIIPFIFVRMKLAFIGALILVAALLFLPLPARLDAILTLLQNIDMDSVVAAFYVSGFRFPSVVASYVFSLSEFTFGGVGSWYTRILTAYSQIGINIEDLGHFVHTKDWGPTKPHSLFASISLEFGIYGLIFSVIMLYRFLRVYIDVEPRFKPYLLVSIFGIFFLSAVGNPSFSLILALGLAGRLKAMNTKF